MPDLPFYRTALMIGEYRSKDVLGIAKYSGHSLVISSSKKVVVGKRVWSLILLAKKFSTFVILVKNKVRVFVTPVKVSTFVWDSLAMITLLEPAESNCHSDYRCANSKYCHPL